MFDNINSDDDLEYISNLSLDDHKLYGTVGGDAIRRYHSEYMNIKDHNAVLRRLNVFSDKLVEKSNLSMVKAGDAIRRLWILSALSLVTGLCVGIVSTLWLSS